MNTSARSEAAGEGAGDRHGLSTAEAAARLARDGPNLLRGDAPRGVVRQVLAALGEPMLLLLFAAAALYLWLGDRAEAIALLASAAVACAITVTQQLRAERALAALRALASPRALVIRDGVQQRIAGRDVVRGDLLVVHEGDRIAADARLVEAHGLRVDESLLTGESVPVDKQADQQAAAAAGAAAGPRSDRIYAQTLVVHGSALAEVEAIGAATACGQIGAALAGVQFERSPLQRDFARLARRLALFAVLLSLALAAAHAWRFGDPADGLLKGLTLAMAIVPEELPIVVTLFLALGAWRLSRLDVLTRRASAIEALGAATVLCVDKTGTLTENRMRVRSTVPAAGAADGELLRVAALACTPEPFDPMERALLDAARAAGTTLPPAAALCQRIPLAERRLLVGFVWREAVPLLAVKGAPEAVLARCALAPAERAALLDEARVLAAAGERVLGVASVVLPHWEPGFDIDGAAMPALRWHGLVGLQDPLRASVPTAVAQCHAAGVRVAMITGDFPPTALAIARQAGITRSDAVLSGGDIAALSDEALRERVGAVEVFARVSPQQKLALIRALQARGEVVAMTGDGVNDAPALKAAHIGVAMGGRGSDVAREAAALVLLRDDFAALVAAVAQGRRIFANLRQVLIYLIAVHLPVIGASLLPVLAGTPALLMPIHVMFLEFIIDPACAFAFEAEPATARQMQSPPRPPAEGVLRRRDVGLALLQGGLGTALVVAIALLAPRAGLADDMVRTLVFVAIVLVNLALIVVNRHVRGVPGEMWQAGNRALRWVVLLALGALAVVLLAPPARRVFRLAEPGVEVLVVVAAAAVWVALILLGTRLATRRRPGRSAGH